MASRRSVIGASCLLTTLLAGSVGLGQTLTNAGFESGMTGWETFGSGWRTSGSSNATDSDAHSGSLGLVNDVMEKDKDEWRGVSQGVEAEHGMVYSASAWVRTLNAKDAECCLEFQFIDKDGKVISFKQSDPVSVDQPFTRIGIEFVEPPKLTRTLLVRGVVHMTHDPDKETDFFVFDDFELSVTNKSSKSASDGRKNLSPADRIRERQKARGTSP
jgi:hypothetical protein